MIAAFKRFFDDALTDECRVSVIVNGMVTTGAALAVDDDYEAVVLRSTNRDHNRVTIKADSITHVWREK